MNYPEQRFLPELRGHSIEGAQSETRIMNLLSPEQQARLANIASLVDVRTGGLIFGEGNRADFIYAVAAGMVRISRCSASGRRQVLDFVFPGDMLGYHERGIYVNSARALSPARLYRLPWSKLGTLLQQDPELHASFLARAAFDLRQAQKRIMTLGQQNVAQRLASFLLNLVEQPQFYDSQLHQLSLPLTRFDLADYLGTTPETVVRVLARLEQEGVIRRLSARLLEIRRLDWLSTLLEAGRRGG
jgi:CRP-like cAMP-binding protein